MADLMHLSGLDFFRWQFSGTYDSDNYCRGRIYTGVYAVNAETGDVADEDQTRALVAEYGWPEGSLQALLEARERGEDWAQAEPRRVLDLTTDPPRYIYLDPEDAE